MGTSPFWVDFVSNHGGILSQTHNIADSGGYILGIVIQFSEFGFWHKLIGDAVSAVSRPMAKSKYQRRSRGKMCISSDQGTTG